MQLAHMLVLFLLHHCWYVLPVVGVITQAVCNSFKTQILQGVHNFSNISATAGSVAAGTGVYTVTLTGGANNGLAGQVMVAAGFGTAANNGTYSITASNATTVTTTNTNSANSGAMGTCTLGDTFKLALYTSSASLDKTTTNYSATNEVGNSGSYAAGGGALVSTTPVLSTDTSCCLFNTLSFTSATIAARGALIYNSSKVLNAAGGAACFVLNFGSDQTSTNGTFSITFPAQTAGNAILGLA
jgi:hypothetical protein